MKICKLILIVIVIIFNISKNNAQVYINEVLASNILTNLDSDVNNYSDWIELFNSTNQYLNLSGYHLTDNIAIPDKWTFPSGVEIIANSYLIVWADGIDTSLTNIHTNFKLSSTGETIGLYSPTNELIDLITFQSQIADVSVGRFPDGAVELNFFTTPTPNSQNITTNYLGITPSPQFSISGGYYQNSVSVEITCISTTAEIRYTLDGSEPDLNSMLYETPLQINDLATIRAIAIDDGNFLPSHVISQTYYFAETNFEPTLPIISINTGGQEIFDEPSIFAHMAVLQGELNVPNDFDNQVSIQIRGSSSQSFPKKQYRIETQNNHGEDLDVSLLGLPAESDWVLYAPYTDKSLIRDVLVYDISRSLDYYSPRSRFCELFLNNEYMGVYVLLEKPKTGNERIDIENLETFDDTEPDISGGYIFKYDRGNQIIWTQSDLSFVPVYPKEEKITYQQIEWLQNYLNNLENALDAGGIDYKNFINDTSFVDNFFMVEAFKNIDGYRLSTYFTKDKNQKLIATPVWDYNLSSGNADYLEGWEPTGWYIDQISYDYYMTYWWLSLKNNPNFWQLCSERWLYLRKTVLNTANIENIINNYVILLDEAKDRNFEKWQILGTYIWPNYFIANTYEEEIEFMKQFLNQRFNWIDEQFGFNSLTLNFNLSNAEQGKISVNNSFEITQNLSGNYFYNTPIKLNAIPKAGYDIDYWMFENSTNEYVTLIAEHDLWKYSDNGLNLGTNWKNTDFEDSEWLTGYGEFGYGDGDETTTINYGDNPDQKYVTTYFRKTFNIENTDEIINIELSILRDDGAVVYINGNEVIRSNMPVDSEIFFDTFASATISDSEETTYYTYVIDNEFITQGENLIAVEVHQCNYSSSDLSFDLSLEATYLSSASTITYSDKIQIDTTFSSDMNITAFFKEKLFDNGLFINEIMAQNSTTYSDEAGDFDDWYEIYNSNNYEVDLSGYFITDEKLTPQKWQIPYSNEMKIEPSGFKVFWADNEVIESNLHSNFKLSAGGEFLGISFFDGTNYQYIDSLSFSIQNTDISFGRYTDGENNLEFFNTPTPNATNIRTTINKPVELSTSNLNCYPNPFSESTKIEFNLSDDNFVMLNIFDYSGKLIQTVINEQMTAGKYEFYWTPYKTSGLNLTGNIFIIQLKTLVSVENFKIVLLK